LPTYNGQVHSSADLIFIGANSFEHFCLLGMIVVSIKQS
jgi:hypothetical protein